jgi:hypothetical protein
MRAALAALVLAIAPLQASTPADPVAVSSLDVRRALGPVIEERDAAAAIPLLTTLADMGFALSKGTRQRFAEFIDAPAMAVLDRRFDANAAPLDPGGRVAELPLDLKLVEGIAHDRKTGTTYYATVVSRALWASKRGVLTRVALPEATGSLFGLAIDGRRRLLWAASGVADPTPGAQTAFKGLIAIDLDGRKPPAMIRMPGDASPADILLARDGSVFVADGAAGGVYRCDAPCATIVPMVARDLLRGPQGMVESADRSALIVSGYGTGLWRVPIAGGAPQRIAATSPAMLDGIDGMTASKGRVIAIQNGTVPRRIVEIRLSTDGARLTALKPLVRVAAEAGEPTLGTMIGRDFVYIADAQWELWDKGGVPRKDAAPRPTEVRKLRLD